MSGAVKVRRGGGSCSYEETAAAAAAMAVVVVVWIVPSSCTAGGFPSSDVRVGAVCRDDGWLTEAIWNDWLAEAAAGVEEEHMSLC